MSAESTRVLYVGEAMSGFSFKNCVEPLGWYVYMPTTRLEALGTFISCVPHLVIVDGVTGSTLGQDVYRHIRSVDMTPVIFVGETQEQIDEATRLLPADTSLSTLIFAARQLVGSDQ